MTEQRSRWVPQPFGPGWLRDWLKRHQHPISFVLHLIGIPMTVCAILPLLFDVTSISKWWWALLMFVSGYGLQFLGHAIEGNDAGEMILVKKWLGKPYIAIAPRWEEPNVATAPTTHS